MKNYDDLQRFKEKTQTLDIAFKDMSGQTQEADQSQWAIIRQLAADEDQETLGGGQRIDLPQPQPIRGNEFDTPPQQPQVAPVASSVRGSILDSLAATPAAGEAPTAVSSLFPPAPAKPSPSATPVAPKATHVERQATTSLFPPPPPKPVEAPVAPAVVPEPAVVPAPVAVAPPPVFAAPVAPAQPAAAPSRFGALFRSRPAEPVNLSKETLLKPLLEKIALCR
ncbi:cellulose biosynthesis protein BcsO [Pantoea phytobeneficialis]|uniref:Cellulose biosynthesis protein BcsO n=1 Tax=Pantoea phytobeneficialis TaxID=2052056 RepID=A0AAP9H1P9_9GAMM|nr:cellulose biosynthesis protein BcsO [Pantoea phytobeneficialis]MDO6408342.1 cellulose biosynthesis protein BcsO [Pantoea phytobeneficialis]QGR04987.1 cellulose biosynthesis protein BcsO [Pantoea phytobeneficialis]